MDMENITGVMFDIANETITHVTNLAWTSEGYTTDSATTADPSGTSSIVEATTLSTTTTTTTTTEKPCVWNSGCDFWVQFVYNFVRYGLDVCYAIGIPGSFLTLIILFRMKPLNSSSVWLVVLSSTDLFSLSMRCILNQLMLHIDNYWNTDSCRFFHIMADFCEYTSYYYLLGLTTERFIAVWFPLKMSIWCTAWRAVMGIAAIQVCVMGSCLHMVETRRMNAWKDCVIRKKYRAFWSGIYNQLIMNTLMYVVPLLSLLILNALIFHRLRTARKVQKQMSEQKNKEKERQQRQINRMLLAATIWFFITTFPEIVIRYLDAVEGDIETKEPALLRYRFIAYNSSAVIRCYNHAANFILYVIAARKFRSELIKLITCNRFTGIGQRAVTKTKMTTGFSGTKVTSDGTSASG